MSIHIHAAKPARRWEKTRLGTGKMRNLAVAAFASIALLSGSVMAQGVQEGAMRTPVQRTWGMEKGKDNTAVFRHYGSNGRAALYSGNAKREKIDSVSVIYHTENTTLNGKAADITLICARGGYDLQVMIYDRISGQEETLLKKNVGKRIGSSYHEMGKVLLFTDKKYLVCIDLASSTMVTYMLEEKLRECGIDIGMGAYFKAEGSTLYVGNTEKVISIAIDRL